MVTYEIEMKTALKEKAGCDDEMSENIAKKWFATGLKLRDLLSTTDHDLEDDEFTQICP